MKICRLFWIVFALGLSWSSAPASEQDDIRRAVSLLDYIGRDYSNAVDEHGKIVSDAEYAEMKDFITLIEGYIAGNESLPALRAAIEQRATPQAVGKLASGLRETLIQIYGIQTVPSVMPDLAQGKRIYEQSCATCHGIHGDADTPVAKTLEPVPSAFSDPSLLDQLSPFQAFNTITYGVNGTAMAGFASFPENDRWALASYLFTLRKGDPKDATVAKISWKDALAKNDAEISKALRGAGVPDEKIASERSAVRRFAGEAIPAETAGASRGFLAASLSKLEESRNAFAKGDAKGARDLSVAAYLDGFEKVESVLTSQGKQGMIAQVESGFLQYRRALESGKADEIEAAFLGTKSSIAKVDSWLAEGASKGGSSALLGTFVILFREGLEALLLVSLVLACLGKVGADGMKKWVHASWVFALVLGMATWFFAQKLLSGADRESMEGWISLLACGVLIYVSFWILSKRDSAMWVNYLMQKLRGKGSVGMLTVISVSFFAVYREVFETVLFLQALRMHAAGQDTWILGGIILSIVTLASVAQAIFYFGKKLPIHKFFSTSGYLLSILATVFLGQGIHSLGEAGLVDLQPFPFWTVPSLGIFPFWGTLIPQSLLALVFIGAHLIFRFRPHWIGHRATS